MFLSGFSIGTLVAEEKYVFSRSTVMTRDSSVFLAVVVSSIVAFLPELALASPLGHVLALLGDSISHLIG
jgi:hypothetical protein